MDERSGQRLTLMGAVGALGALGGVVADLFSGYASEGAANVRSPFSVLDLHNLDAFLSTKPLWHFVVGNHLALLFIPLGIFGVLHVARLVEPAGPRSRRLWIGFGVGGYVVGTAFHLMYGFMGIAMRVRALEPDGSAAIAVVLSWYRLLHQPVAVLLIAIMTVAVVWVTLLIVLGRTSYPRWLAAFSPLTVQLATALLVPFVPTGLRLALIVTTYNFSFFVFFLASTMYVARRGDGHRSGVRPGS